MVPEGLKYTKEHEWVRFEGDEAVFGITEHAQSALGDVTYIELPEVGRKIEQAGSFATVESVKAANDIYAPVSGTIIRVNEKLNDKPESINQSPYNEGWIARVSVSDRSEEARLLDSDAYEKYLKEEKH